MNLKRIIALALAVIMVIGIFASCSARQDENYTDDDGKFNYSRGLDENGFFKGVKAADYINLADYKNYEMPYNLTVASVDDVNEQLDLIKDGYTKTEKDTSPDRIIADGDTVNIDYVGSIDGVEFDGGSTGGNGTDVTLGVTNYIDGFLPQLIGHKPGDVFDINVTFPDDYTEFDYEQYTYVPSPLAGKDAVFNITINHLYNEIVPEINDDFVKENMSEYYDSARRLLKDIEDRIVENRTKNYVWDKLMGESEMTGYPEAMKEYELNYQRRYLNSQAASYGTTGRELLASIGYESEDEYFADLEDDINQAIKLYCVVQAICENENIKVTDEDMTGYFVKNFGTEDYSYYEEIYGKNYLKMVVSQEIMLEKLIADMKVGPRQDENRED